MNGLEYPGHRLALPLEEGGGFLATVPGCMSDGETPQEEIINVQDAIAAWTEATGNPAKLPEPPRQLALA